MNAKKLLPVGTLGLAGLVAAGVMVMPSGTATAGSSDRPDTGPATQDAVVKREEGTAELVLAADDNDDDDTNGRDDRTRATQDNTRSRNTGVSRATRDNTRSNNTLVSRDRDLSRSDKTRDWTRDGGDRTRDLTPDLTNDRSRNDTRR